MCTGCDVLIIVFHPVPEDDVLEVHSCDRWMSSVIFLYTPRYIRPAGNSDITTIYYQHPPRREGVYRGEVDLNKKIIITEENM